MVQTWNFMHALWGEDEQPLKSLFMGEKERKRERERERERMDAISLKLNLEVF